MSWITGFENMYKIYENGDVERYSKTTKPKILKHSISTHGYKCVHLYKNNKRKIFRIHRLLALNFIDNPNNYPFVDHIDRDRQNNNLENLRWASISINCRNKKNYGKYMKGVTKTGKKFKSEIWINGKNVYLGTFDTELEAHQVFMIEHNKIMEDFTNLH